MRSMSRVFRLCRTMTACVVAVGVLLLPCLPAGAQTVTFESLLHEMIDRDAITKFPAKTFTTTQFSSYDRASTSADKPETWFANNDAGQFVRIDENAKAPGGKEYVLMDTTGPGAIVRFWSANPPDNSTLRFYIDGSAAPVLDVPFQGFLNGRWLIAEPLSSLKARGFNSYVPIPYAKSMKVVMCLAAPADKTPGVYYQINCRNYAAGTAVESFAPEAIDKAKAAIDEVQLALTDPRKPFMDPPADTITSDALIVNPGETKTLPLPKGPAAVRYMAMGIHTPTDAPSDRALGLQNVVIQAEFDGEKTIWCPLGAFFGGGVGFNKSEDWYRNMTVTGHLHCRWVMPYKTSGSFSITNTGKASYTVRFNVVTKPYASWDEGFMHFHAAWNYEYPIHTKKAAGTKDWNYVEIEGKGIFVADTLAVMNPVGDWWGEGDEKIYVDGEKFPSHFGTGTEDYYGYAWCSNQIFEHPFHGQSRCDGKDLGNNYGNTTVTRTRSLDVIPFTKSFKFDMEVWHWRAADVAYGATTYFYAMPGAKINIKPQPENSGRDLLVPPRLPAALKVDGAIECDKLRIASKADGVTAAAQGGFGPDMWSGGTHLWVQAHKPGDFIELEVPLPADLKGKPVQVVLYATRSWDYGIVRFSVGGKQLGKDTDFFNDKAKEAAATGPLEMGVFQPAGDTFTLRCEVVGGNAKSEGAKSFFGLDCLVLKKAE